MFLKFKQLFKKKDYTSIITLAMESNTNLASANIYIRSVVVSPFSIEYTKEEIAKAKEIMSELDKIPNKTPDKIQ